MMENFLKLASFSLVLMTAYKAGQQDVVKKLIIRAREGMQEIQRDNARAFLAELREPGKTLPGGDPS